MKRLFFTSALVLAIIVVTGCASTKGLSDEAKNNVPTSIWYKNAMLLIDANDPDMKADAHTGIPGIDGPIDTVKDIISLVPRWTVAKVEERHFNNMYMESAKALNSGTEGAKLVVKGEAFKTTLLLDTFKDEDTHARNALALDLEARKANYADNAKVYKEAENKVNDYANNQILAFESCNSDDARTAFFTDATRKQWDNACDEIVAKIMDCVDKSDDVALTRQGKAKLCKEMNVQSVDWMMVAQRLEGDLAKLEQASMDISQAIANPELAAKIAASQLGAEIVPGVSGKETLAAINRARKQLVISIRLIGWLIKVAVE